MIVLLLSVLVLTVIVLPTEAQSGLSVVAGNKQYYIDALQTGNFYEGVHFCAQYGMTLASIENKAEFNRLFAILRTNDIIKINYWISGMSYGLKTIYTWLGTGRRINYWGEVSPTVFTTAERCLSLAQDTLKFEESACVDSATNGYSFICEKPLEPNCGTYGQCRYTYSYNTN